MMEFSSPVITGCLPSPRSWHASAVLPRQRVFIHGGYDGNQILTDSFIFNIGKFSIGSTKIRTPFNNTINMQRFDQIL